MEGRNDPVDSCCELCHIASFENELTPEERDMVFPKGVEDSVRESKHIPGTFMMPNTCTVTNTVLLKACKGCGTLLPTKTLMCCAKCVNLPRASTLLWENWVSIKDRIWGRTHMIHLISL